MTKIANIAKNTSYFTLALILQKVISFTYFIVIARALGPEDLGKYYFAISFTTIFAVFIDLGLANVLTREVARAEEKAGQFLNSVLAVKLPLSVISFGALVILTNVLGYPELTRQLIYLSSVSMLLDSFTASFYAVSRGFHNLFFESVGSVIFQIIVLLSGIFILRGGGGLRWLIGALALASIFNFLYSFVLVWRKWGVKIKLQAEWAIVRTIIKIAIPFGLFGIFQRVYTYLDSVLLSSLAGDIYVGFYQVAFKIIFALQFLPAAFIASLYPAMSAYWQKNREQLGIIFERAMNYLIIISLPIAVGIISLADKIVLLFKSGYGGSVLPLQLNMLALPFIFLAFPVGSLLNACDRQKTNTVIMGVGLAASVIMNVILIPRFQAVGASVTVLAVNALMFILGMMIVPRITPYKAGRIIKVFFKSLISVAVMAAAALYLKSFINIFAVVAMGGVVYFFTLVLLKGLRKEDIISVWRSFAKKTNAEIID
ncbi:flippase [Candidatus Falkowbacteria bacterium]|nr:flippase [Candidatus Falkowbacteria bacterium]